MARLQTLAAAEGRDPTELTVALIDGIVVSNSPLGPERPPLHGTPEQIVEGLHAFADAGLQHLVAGVRLAGDGSFAASVGALDTLAADVLPLLDRR